MRILPLILAAASALASTVAAAQPTSIAHEADKPWLHAPTGLSFPAEVGGLQRTGVRRFSAPDVDVAAIYGNADESEAITLYLYRNTSGDVPVWFDRARVAILARRQLYGEITPTGVRAFVPHGQDRASGLMESYRTTGPYSSTMLAVLPVKGFYAKVRASSASKDSAALEVLVREILDGIAWTSDRQHALAAAVADCPAPLPTGKPAKQIAASREDRMMSAILGGLVAQVPANPKAEPAAPPPTFCREPGPAQMTMGIYRPNASTERYTIAVGDAGQAVVVGRNELAEIAAKSRQPRYSVSVVRLHETASFADFSALPSPEQVIQMVGSSRPTSVATTWGQQRTINIDPR